jgi:hypothetical protein
MGVDTRILIKVTDPDEWLDAASLRSLSTKLTSIIGADHFFLQPEKDRHALSFVEEKFRHYTTKYPDDFQDDDGKPLYPPGHPVVFWQDGDDIVAQPNEQFLECHMGTRYYGEGYARGDWKTISFVLKWLLLNIPSSEVWYGGDSSGCVLEKMTTRRINAITKFFFDSGHETYSRHFNRGPSYKCQFCQCNVSDTGGGGDISFWYCPGCDSNWVTYNSTRGNPETVTKYDRYGIDRELKDFDAVFQISSQMKAGKRKVQPFNGVFPATNAS